MIVNTGLGYEAPHHKRVFDAVRPGPTPYVHEHPGARRPCRRACSCSASPARCTSPRRTTWPASATTPASASLRLRTAGNLVRHDRPRRDAHRGGEPRCVDASGHPQRPTSPSDERLDLDVDGLRLELIAAVGETVDSMIVWLPEHRLALDQQPAGPVVPAFPQSEHAARRPLPTGRALPRVACAGSATARSPRCSSPGATSRSSGAELIDASLARLHDAVDWVHRADPRRDERRHRPVDH